MGISAMEYWRLVGKPWFVYYKKNVYQVPMLNVGCSHIPAENTLYKPTSPSGSPPLPLFQVTSCSVRRTWSITFQNSGEGEEHLLPHP